MPNAIFALYALLLGLSLGLGSAFWATGRGYPFGAVRSGAWTTWPRAGSRDVDPYTRAVMARTGDLPLGVGEGLAFLASTDDEKRPLSADCRYRIGPTVPQARFWTLTVYGDGQLSQAPLRRSGFTSAEIVRQQDGGFSIVLAREPQPGNWLPAPVNGPLGLSLRLYDTPVASVSGSIDGRTLPLVTRLDCGR